MVCASEQPILLRPSELAASPLSAGLFARSPNDLAISGRYAPARRVGGAISSKSLSSYRSLNEDNVRLYWIPSDALPKTLIIGSAPPQPPPNA
jgi:hypothetical protein